MSMKTILTNLAVAAALLVCSAAKTFSQTNTMNAETKTDSLATATFGGGCFWCTEAMYQTVKGVKSVVSGYAGGARPNPTYEQVCTGVSGHAEVIQITFDPREVSYARLVDIFWDAHDPTTLNAQGADHGTQYRSTIMFNDDAQRVAAEESKQKAQAKFKKSIVTEIVPLKTFYPAERYHQDYFKNNPNQPYCEVVIRPKLEKFEAKQKP
ncbi:MAG: Peptide methionine sulfoxide reductase MsrA [Verrucomicrobiota bacterium]|jgi:peptide-methionine (S)-S-oxide reductase